MRDKQAEKWNVPAKTGRVATLGKGAVLKLSTLSVALLHSCNHSFAIMFTLFTMGHWCCDHNSDQFRSWRDVAIIDHSNDPTSTALCSKWSISSHAYRVRH